MAVLVTGGARSGKSGFAERLAASRGKSGRYVATSQIYDEEMEMRAALHRKQRKEQAFSWVTVEEPYELAGLLRQFAQEQGESALATDVVLVDCLTLWLSNWLLCYQERQNIVDLVTAKLDELVKAVEAYQGHLILVTNEVGSGIVPEYPLGRQYRDLAGRMNQRLASVCPEVFLVTAGIPVELKSIQWRWQ
ncbi:bifunctional adenosylcobinamide kinase/adenosylcobinamide-phosphate guanylyltransferase [Paenibacillus larvae]|uniref:bifunctional adenosylcobinamide kinase/adenosylcobinamide-phosphate guanylyltransferase n=1 Tax=Paenibacillus larvae TaxID=1464 RepID=UPI002891E541|nr:bifunctional adenosylcobinamide kinase/adenosylcobinamide-phosphate guanylyltransferase [Paenibacillus larvae]MDT2231338.1 bifunctional adenosylcobinamide kinase/adenosylcobinamide-phosphate guanylyltransferase [Paenibacillus larvae]